MKIFPKRKLESMQAYDFMYQEEPYGYPDMKEVVMICDFCNKEIPTYKGLCKKCDEQTAHPQW